MKIHDNRAVRCTTHLPHASILDVMHHYIDITYDISHVKENSFVSNTNFSPKHKILYTIKTLIYNLVSIVV